VRVILDDRESTGAQTAQAKACLARLNFRSSRYPSMPDKTPCQRCKKIGFVRFENVIKAGQAERQYYCGACNYTWQVKDEEPRAARPNPPSKRRENQ
jgi:hypothetical protein